MTPFFQQLPKAELHLHIEGTLEPDFLLEKAKKHHIPLPFHSIEEIQNAYNFSNLQSFLNIYYQGMAVLKDEDDFSELAWRYFQKAHMQGVLHAEIFFDPQAHIERGISIATVMDGLCRAVERAKKELQLSIFLIPCFLRHLSEDSALDTFSQCLKFKKMITGFGLDSSEVGNPPSKFQKVFTQAKLQGFRITAHAGEEGPPSFIEDALNLLQAERIDHGVRCLEDEKITKRLVRKKIPLTVCPLSNLKLRVVNKLQEHPLRKMLDCGIIASINSDDPAYFGGYIADNFEACSIALNLTKNEAILAARNSFIGSFLDANSKAAYLQKLELYCSKNPG
ncbi:MAG: adenosine deaminase [Planctomycetes bacterium]|nr:adenosine deaminase [Planctomycetota bacterium]